MDYMVAFDNPSCKVEWYRVSCVGLEQVPEDDETWYSDNCLSLEKTLM